MNRTLRRLFEDGCFFLQEREIENSRFEAMQMTLFAAKIDRTDYVLKRDEPADEKTEKIFEECLCRRAAGIPLQYILGEWQFRDYVFKVGKGVLIPRPETEQLTDICCEIIRDGTIKTVFDLCAGSGCIGISLALECPWTEAFLFELYDGAFGYLQKNAQLCPDGRLHLIKHDVLTPPPDSLPVPEFIVSNPPYIPRGQIQFLQREVQAEPKTALDGGCDGLLFFEAFARVWMPLLKPGGYFAAECGEGQSAYLLSLFSKFGETEIIKDCFGEDRFVLMKKFER